MTATPTPLRELIANTLQTAYLAHDDHHVTISLIDAMADAVVTALSARDEAGSWNAAIEAAAQEAEHWQERSTPHHECGRYIAGAIRARFATPPASGEAGACNCASGRGAEHCVVHAPNDVLPRIATPPASGEAWADAYSDFTRAELIGLLETAYDQLNATPPAASGDGLIARLRIIATDYKPGSILRNTLDEAIRRLAAVAPAGMVRCSHNWLDYGEHAGNNLAYCPRCKMISAVGKEGVPYGLPTPPATAGQE